MVSNNQFSIYKIENTVNGKKYIGQTRCPVEYRWRSHLHQLRHNKHHSSYLQRSWNKHGEHSFIFEVICVTTDIDQLDGLEQELIKSFDTTNRQLGYNIHAGGNTPISSVPWNKGRRDLPPAWNKGKTTPDDVRQKLSKIHKERFNHCSSPMLGRKHTEEAKAKISIGRGITPFNVYNKVTKEHMGTWSSLAKCGSDLNIKNYRNIGHVLSGKRKTCDGYVFTRGVDDDT